MSGEIAPKKIGRGYERNLGAGPFQPMVSSFELHLRAEKKSAKTIRTYLEAAQWFAAEYLIPAGVTDWDEVRAKQVQEWTVTLLGRYSDSYASNQFRALQQFFKWHATEDPDEPRLNPMANLKPPKISDKLVPVFTDDELEAGPVASDPVVSRLVSALAGNETGSGGDPGARWPGTPCPARTAPRSSSTWTPPS